MTLCVNTDPEKNKRKMKHLTKIWIVFVALSAAMPTFAGPWSLDSCINYAIDHNLTVKARQLEVEGAELSVTEARDKYLPTAAASASQGWAFGRGLTAQNTYADRNTSQFGWNIGVELPIFQGLSAYRQEKVARANLVAILQQTDVAKDDVTLNVMAQYLQALYCKELTAVATEQRNLSKIEVERREILLENGKIPEADLLEAKAQLASDESTLTQNENNYRLALVELAQLLNLGVDIAGFDVAPLPDRETLIPSPEDVYRNALVNNSSVLATRQQINVAERQIELAKTGYYPQLSFSLGLGSSHYHLNGEINPSFGRQMRDNYSTSMSFRLQIPLFDAFSTRNNINRAKLQRKQAELQAETTESDLFKAIQRAYYEAVSAKRKIEASEAAVVSTRAAFNVMQDKYNFGRANATEFEQSKTAYIKAQADAVQARMELILRYKILEFYNRH